MSLVDKGVIKNESVDDNIDDGFIQYPNHRLFITEPEFDNDGYLDISPLAEYLNQSDVSDVMKSILLFADKTALTKEEIERTFRLADIFTYTGHQDIYTYDDLQYVLSLVRTYYYKDDGELLSDHTIQTIKKAIERVQTFRRTYEHDNASLPYGYNKELYTNLAKFFYVFEMGEDDNEEEMIQKHTDTDRPLRKQKGGYVGDYSVIYNPLLNKLFLWDFSKEHMADLK